MSYGVHVHVPVRATADQRAVPQSESLPGRAMMQNRAGGMVFEVDAWVRLRRFLVLGTDTSVRGRDGLTVSNAASVVRALEGNGLHVVSQAVFVSVENLAPSNDPALFVLAMAASFGISPLSDVSVPECGVSVKGDDVARRLVSSMHPDAAYIRRAALAALPSVARTGTHIMHFAQYVNGLRGWGPALRQAVARWFTEMNPERLSLQAVKYRNRDGWSLRDLLRLSHPLALTREQAAVFDWIAHADSDDASMAAHDLRASTHGRKVDGRPVVKVKFAGPVIRATPRHPDRTRPVGVVRSRAGDLFPLIEGYHLVQEAASAVEAARVIRSHTLPFETVPSWFLDNKEVWDALLEEMPATNMLRNLGKMSAVGLLTPGSDAARVVCARLRDSAWLAQSRVHPYAFLLGLRTYAQGHGFRGSNTWTPVPLVTDALDDGFHAAFKTVHPSGARCEVGLDVSDSMSTSMVCSGGKKGPLTAREAAAAMVMVTTATEPDCTCYGFTSATGMRRDGTGLTLLDLGRRRSLSDAVQSVSDMSFGATDAGLIIKHALDNSLSVDAFIIYTDNESWSGRDHVTNLLRRYRERSGIDARLVCVAFAANEYSVADPADAGQMDLAGFDASAPAVISDFIRTAVSPPAPGGHR